MARPLNKLSAVAVRNAAPGKYIDGGGLMLVKREDGGGVWVLRFAMHSRRREMGLGSIAAVSLKEARETASRWRDVIRNGKDPIAERVRLRRVAERNLHLLNDVAADAFNSRKSSLKDDGAAGRWFSPLELHVLPKLGKMPIVQIDQIAIRDALKSIWTEKPETARKAITRLGIVFHHAAALGLDVDLQATKKAEALLGSRRHDAEHIPSLSYQALPAFYESLGDGSITHLALRLLILTGARSRPLRYMTFDQIENNIWTIPASMMKGRIGQVSDFRIPLSSEALSVIERARPLSRDGYLFPSPKQGVISDATMARLMERRSMKERPHGFRASLRNWIAETQLGVPFEIAETVLGHTVGSKVTRAYLTSDHLDERAKLMEAWGEAVSATSRNIRGINK